MKIITHEKVTLDELKQMSEKIFHRLVKAVVDVELGIMAIDAGLHSDQEGVLLQNGSKQENLWGINFHPENGGGEDFIRSRGVDDPKIQAKIRAIVSKLVVL